MNGKEKLIFTKDSIRIDIEESDLAHYVMHSAEKSLMEKLADITTVNGGNILEIGFGMGLCSNRIQENENVSSHTIIEVHPEIYNRALEWAKDKKNVNIIFGDWIEVIPKINDIRFDGVLHDTHSDPNISKLIDIVYPICNKNCVVAFFMNPNSDFDIHIHSLNEEEHSALPYRNTHSFKDNKYKIKYKVLKDIK